MESLHTILHVHVSFYPARLSYMWQAVPLATLTFVAGTIPACAGQCARACAVRVKHNKKRGCSAWAWSRRLTTAIIRFAHAPRSWSVKMLLEPSSGLTSEARRIYSSCRPLFMAVFVVRTPLLFACFWLPVSVL